MARRAPDASAGPAVRALVVDDEPSAREVVLTLLAEFPGVRVVGEATNGREAVELVRRLENPRLVADPPPYRPSPVLRGPLHLPVEIDGVRD